MWAWPLSPKTLCQFGLYSLNTLYQCGPHPQKSCTIVGPISGKVVPMWPLSQIKPNTNVAPITRKIVPMKLCTSVTPIPIKPLPMWSYLQKPNTNVDPIPKKPCTTVIHITRKIVPLKLCTDVVPIPQNPLPIWPLYTKPSTNMAPIYKNPPPMWPLSPKALHQCALYPKPCIQNLCTRALRFPYFLFSP